MVIAPVLPVIWAMASTTLFLKDINFSCQLPGNCSTSHREIDILVMLVFNDIIGISLRIQRRNSMSRSRRISGFEKIAMTVILLIAASMVMVSPARATDATDAQGLVDKARITFSEFMGDNQYWWLRDHLKDAKGILIYPQVIKGGFILGGSGGTGVFLVKDEKTGDWSQPAFYTIGSVTFGLQIGGEASQIVVMAMSQKAIDSCCHRLSNSVEMFQSLLAQ